MLQTLLLIETYFGKVEAAIPKSKLSEMFGIEVVNTAIEEGCLTEFRPFCQRNCDPICWINDNGRNRAQKPS